MAKAEASRPDVQCPASDHLSAVLLGCTHYPLLADAFRAAIGDGVELIDSAERTAMVLADELPGMGLLADRGGAAGTLTCMVSDNPERFARIGSRFLGRTIERVRYIGPEEFFNVDERAAR